MSNIDNDNYDIDEDNIFARLKFARLGNKKRKLMEMIFLIVLEPNK